MILAEAQTLAVNLSNRVGNGYILSNDESILFALQEISDLLVPVRERVNLIKMMRDNKVPLFPQDEAVLLLVGELKKSLT